MKTSAPNPQQGFSLIVVLFLLVALGGLGAVITQLSTVQHLETLNALQGRQAHYAARTAADWARYRLSVAGEDCATVLGDSLMIGGLSATVLTCTQTSVNEGGAMTMFNLQVNVTGNAGSLDEVSRTIRMTLYR